MKKIGDTGNVAAVEKVALDAVVPERAMTSSRWLVWCRRRPDVKDAIRMCRKKEKNVLVESYLAANW